MFKANEISKIANEVKIIEMQTNERVDLSRLCFFDSQIIPLLENTCLKYLNLSQNNLTFESCKNLAMIIQTNPLEVLILKKNKVGGNGISHMAPTIQKSSLTELDVSANDISEVSEVTFQQIISPKMISLNLCANRNFFSQSKRKNEKWGGNGRGERVVSAFQNASLTKLDLRTIKISSSVAHVLAKGFSVNKSLKSFNMWISLFTGKDIEIAQNKVFDGLSKNISLEEIKFGFDNQSTNMTHCNLIYLAQLFGKQELFPLIRKLSITRAKTVGEQGFVELVKSLAERVRLHELDLHMTGVGDATAMELANVLISQKKESRIKKMWLSHNKISNHGAAALLAAVKENLYIKSIQLRGNPIQDKTILSELKNTLVHNRIQDVNFPKETSAITTFSSNIIHPTNITPDTTDAIATLSHGEEKKKIAFFRRNNSQRSMY